MNGESDPEIAESLILLLAGEVALTAVWRITGAKVPPGGAPGSKARMPAATNTMIDAGRRASVHGGIINVDLSLAENLVVVQRDGLMRRAWAVDDRRKSARIIQQTIAEQAVTAPKRVVFVVDGSRFMSGDLPAIAESIEALPEGIEFAVIVADDQAAISPEVEAGSLAVYGRAADRITRLKASGGQDNVPALIRAWDLAAERDSAVVVWIYGPQPILLENGGHLRQRFEPHPRAPVLYEVQTRIGPNRVVEQLDGIATVQSLPRLGRLREDLDRLTASWRPGSKRYAFTRFSRNERGDVPGSVRDEDRFVQRWNARDGEVGCAAAHPHRENGGEVLFTLAQKRFPSRLFRGHVRTIISLCKRTKTLSEGIGCRPRPARRSRTSIRRTRGKSWRNTR